MDALEKLLSNNRDWAALMKASDPEYFSSLADMQRPEYLWIGCSDSRVPANQITGLKPGQVFVHRNVANLVVHTDLNCLSAIHFAVDVLKTPHIIVTGHYGCGGITAAMNNERLGQVDNWLRHVKDVRSKHRTMIEKCAPHKRVDRLCELNVIEQTLNVCETTVVEDAWARKQPVTVHAWVYSLEDGLLRDLQFTSDSADAVWDNYETAIKRLDS